MEAALKEAQLALTRAANDMAHFYNAHSQRGPLYTVRDKVWLNGQNIMTTCLMKKLDHIWLGPYSGQIYLTKHLQAQATFGLQPNPPIFSVTLQWPYKADTITK